MLSNVLRRNRQVEKYLPISGWAEIWSGGLIFRINFGTNDDCSKPRLVPISSVDLAHDLFQRSDGKMYRLISIDWMVLEDRDDSSLQHQAQRVTDRNELIVRFRELAYDGIRILAVY